MNEEALDAKTIIGMELALLDINDVRIAKMREEYMPLVITDLRSEKQFDEVHQARMTVKNARVTVEKVSKKKRENAVQFQKDCIAEEKRLVSLLVPIEVHLATEEGKVEAEKERIRAEEEAKEAARIQARVDRICAFGASFNGQMYAVCGLQIPVALVKVCTDDQFEQFVGQIQELKDAEAAKIKAAEEARKAEADRLAKVAAEQEAERQRLVEVARQQAEEAARVKAEQESIARKQAEETARIKAEQEAVQVKLMQERESIERVKQKLVEDEAARLKAIEDEKKRGADRIKREAELEQARKEAAEKAVKDAQERAEREAAEKVEKERKAKEAAERKAARQPDKIKLLGFSNEFLCRTVPDFRTQEARDIISEFFDSLNAAVKTLRDRAEVL